MAEHAIREQYFNKRAPAKMLVEDFASSNSVGAAARDEEDFKQKTAAGNLQRVAKNINNLIFHRGEAFQ